jgi:hypothetical protein
MKPFAGFFERAYSSHFAGATSGGAAALSSNPKTRPANAPICQLKLGFGSLFLVQNMN